MAKRLSCHISQESCLFRRAGRAGFARDVEGRLREPGEGHLLISYGTLPASLQVAGRSWSDGLLLALAYAYEQGTDPRRPPDGFPELSAER